ncbi:MAG: glycosyltransferase family 9 protein [Armatimonadetes bacterium]|nr:glycosyltransferase family 9 protein [Armatimonadota bacterium]
MTAPPKRILIIKTSSLGDIVCSLPVLSQLRNLYPEARIGWVVDSRFADLLAADRRIDELLVFHRTRRPSRAMLAEIAAFCAELRHLGRRLRANTWDVAKDLQSLLKTALILSSSGARIRIAEFARPRHFFSLFAANKRVRPRASHAVVRYLEIAAPLGVRPDQVDFGLQPSEEARAWSEQQVAELQRPRVAVNVGTARPEKMWPPDGFAEAIAAARAEYGPFALVYTGTRAEAPAAEYVYARTGGPAVNVAGRTTLQQLVALLDACDILLTPDSGPMHIMAALGRPVVALFGPTDPAKNGPWGNQHVVIRSPTGRMTDISPETVGHELAQLLARLGARGLAAP